MRKLKFSFKEETDLFTEFPHVYIKVEESIIPQVENILSNSNSDDVLGDIIELSANNPGKIIHHCGTVLHDEDIFFGVNEKAPKDWESYSSVSVRA